jgi:predicted phosphodiesterase
MTHPAKTLGRRAFLQDNLLSLTVGGIALTTVAPMCGLPMAGVRTAHGMSAEAATLRLGLITDLHYADKKPAGTRHYRETMGKLEEAAKHFAEAKIETVVELGDLIDAADTVETELRYLTTINGKFATIAKKRHYVLGNHCVDTLTKQEFLGAVGQERSYYSFDIGPRHFVVLDACFRSDSEPYGRKNFQWTDPNIPAAELEWLKSDLQDAGKPTVVFAHQRLDMAKSHSVKNAAAVREILVNSGHVVAVFQGHSHQNEYQDINGIHYCTLVAMVEGSGIESNGFSVLDWSKDGTITLSGFRKQKDYDWKIT